MVVQPFNALPLGFLPVTSLLYTHLTCHSLSTSSTFSPSLPCSPPLSSYFFINASWFNLCLSPFLTLSAFITPCTLLEYCICITCSLSSCCFCLVQISHPCCSIRTTIVLNTVILPFLSSLLFKTSDFIAPFGLGLASVLVRTRVAPIIGSVIGIAQYWDISTVLVIGIFDHSSYQLHIVDVIHTGYVIFASKDGEVKHEFTVQHLSTKRLGTHSVKTKSWGI